MQTGVGVAHDGEEAVQKQRNDGRMFATLGALIGAGGYGQPILAGIRRDELRLILRGAVPAALLALLAQGLFELAERILVPKGLRLGPRA